MAILSREKRIHQASEFEVLLGDGAELGIKFQKVDGLKQNVEVLSYRGGGDKIQYKEPGNATFDNITLSIGSTGDKSLFDWMKMVVNASANIGMKSMLIKKSITIIQYDRDKEMIGAWRCFDCFPVSFTPGNWDGDSNEFLIEEVELAIERFDYLTI